ncbi:MAG: hypothetical protein DDT30_02029 [Dehalococcoidia bacterium]|nr:hypothetical protein [Bacillota bacterium]MBT9143853.1 hypothetical protein [Bacillota bacterium]
MQAQRRYSMNCMPGTYDTRVFIAGSYRLPSRIKDIAGVVTQCGYVSISAGDFEIPEGQERHYCIALLKECKVAIFELSVESGQLMELERAHDYMPITLCLWDKEDEKTPKISGMVKSSPLFKQNNAGYKNTRELEFAVESFLRSATNRSEALQS